MRPGRSTACSRPGRACTSIWAASEGNHGRAVARAAAQRGLAARIFLPAATSEARAAAIAGEGAEVVRVAGVYEDAVAAAAAGDREPGAATLADVAYDEADPVARWVSDGYSTIFAEAAEQADAPFDVVLCQIGVGSFASAAIRFACHQEPPGDRDRRRARDRGVRDRLARGGPSRGRRDAGDEHGRAQLRHARRTPPGRCCATASRGAS